MGNLSTYFSSLSADTSFYTAVVACTTRELRLRHIRDAKKVNGFFLTFLFTIIPASVLYGVIRDNNLYLHGYIIVHTLQCVYIQLLGIFICA